jgi:hypothetical protein
MGRRGKRLEEQKQLLGRMHRRGKPGSSPARKPPRVSPADPPTLASMAEAPITRRRVATFVNGIADAGGDVTTIDSAIFAPEWPPLKETRKSLAPAPAPAPAPAEERLVGKAAVQEFLRSNGGLTLGVDAWDTAEPDSKRMHARLMRRAGPKRRAPDAYDAEYDLGKVKKVRGKRRGGEEGVGARVFDQAYSAQRAAGPPRGASKKKQQQQPGRRRTS